MSSIYIVDTSTWIDLSQNYPNDVFSGLWTNIANLIKQQRILSPKLVLKEIEQGADDELTKWCKTKDRMFLDSNSIVIGYAAEIIQSFPSLINPYATREEADPFIIALARSLQSNLTDSTPVIITEENAMKPDRIPYVARQYGLTSLKLIEMFKAEKWKF